MSLDERVRDEIYNALDNTAQVRAYISFLLGNAMVQGYGLNRPAVAVRQVTFARELYTHFQSEDKSTRNMLPPFEKMVHDTYVTVLTMPTVDLHARYRIWQQAPEEDKRSLWDEVNGPLYEQARAGGYKPETAFPEPAGMEAWRKTHPKEKTPEPDRAAPAGS